MNNNKINEREIFNALLSYNVKLDKTSFSDPMSKIWFYPENFGKISFVNKENCLISLKERLDYEKQFYRKEIIDDIIYIFEKGLEGSPDINFENIKNIYIFTQNPMIDKVWIQFENYRYSGTATNNLYINYDFDNNIIRKLRTGTMIPLFTNSTKYIGGFVITTLISSLLFLAVTKLFFKK